jgi:hypothetical protein
VRGGGKGERGSGCDAGWARASKAQLQGQKYTRVRNQGKVFKVPVPLRLGGLVLGVQPPHALGHSERSRVLAGARSVRLGEKRRRRE